MKYSIVILRKREIDIKVKLFMKSRYKNWYQVVDIISKVLWEVTEIIKQVKSCSIKAIVIKIRKERIKSP